MKKFFLLLIILSVSASAQIIYTPLKNDIYDFLERMSLKEIIQYHDEVKPFSRKKIASFLSIISKKENLLNEVEKEKLEWYKSEFAVELNIKENQRWYLYSYNDSLFNLKVYPLAGYGISHTGDESGHVRWIGGGFYAAYSDWFGASLDLRDKGEFGGNVDRVKMFSPETGAFFKGAPDGIEFSDVKGSISFDWNWGSVGLMKDYMRWGHGKFGQIIISEKSPSFPFIRLDIHPVEWLRFYYIHGWLNSLVLDSSDFYYTYPNSIEPRLREKYINKYIAANFLSITPLNWIDFSIGNSIIYSGDLRPEFFIPFMFFKFLDHNTGRGDKNDGNGQIFFDIALKPKEFIFYSTLFIDVVEIRNILKNDFHNTWVGYTFGGKKIDFFIPNLDFTVEYTRVNPWVYEHKDQTTTYKNLDFDIGHWIGQNAYQLKFQFDYEFMRGLKFKLYSEIIRKGGLKDIYFGYEDDSPEKFLYHPLRKDFDVGFEASYEPFHDLFGVFKYKYSNIKDEDVQRTPNFMLGKKNSFGFTVFYGL